MTAIEFLTRVPLRKEFVLLSSVLGVIVLVDALNNLPVGMETESSILGLCFTEDASNGVSHFDDLESNLLNRPSAGPLQVPLGKSIASEEKGEYTYVEGYVRHTGCLPIPGAVIDTGRQTIVKVSENASSFFFSLDAICSPVTFFLGLYNVQYPDRLVPDCRGRVVTNQDGKYAYHAVVSHHLLILFPSM